MIDVFDYWVQIAGIDHVSVGLDFTENQTDEWFHWLMSGKRKDSMVTPLELPLKLPRELLEPTRCPTSPRHW